MSSFLQESTLSSGIVHNVCVSAVVRFRSRVLSPKPNVERRYKLWATRHRTIAETFCCGQYFYTDFIFPVSKKSNQSCFENSTFPVHNVAAGWSANIKLRSLKVFESFLSKVSNSIFTCPFNFSIPVSS